MGITAHTDALAVVSLLQAILAGQRITSAHEHAQICGHETAATAVGKIMAVPLYLIVNLSQEKEEILAKSLVLSAALPLSSLPRRPLPYHPARFPAHEPTHTDGLCRRSGFAYSPVVTSLCSE